MRWFTGWQAPRFGVWLLFVLFGCDGVIGEPLGTAEGGTEGPVDPTEAPLTCLEEDLRPTGAPLRRLTPTEYRNTVGDLFRGVSLPPIDLVEDGEVGGFDNNADGQTVSPLLIEQYGDAASAIATAAASDRGWWPCEPTADDCGERLPVSLAERAYRRPLSEEERARVVGFFDRATDQLGFEGAVGALVEGLLQSPWFLYRPEVGVEGDAPEGLVRLGPFELASRLSYLLWQTMPDEALFEAARAGELATPDGIETEARRLLEDPRARGTVVDFHHQWLELRRLEEVQLSPERFPQLDSETREALIASTERFLDEVFWNGGSLEELLTADYGFVNDDLAPIYGVEPPGTDELVRVDLDPEQRAGILTQPGVLASTSHGISHSPILRGVLVLDAMLCMRPPPPPPDVNAAIEEDPGEVEARTTRERIEMTHGTAECASCHDAIDGAGFAFENYDALGRYRLEENGWPVDPTGELTGTRDVDGIVPDGVGMAQRLAESEQVRECFATRWYRYAMGRTERGEDRCQIQALADTLAETGDMRELLVAIVRSPSFRHRPVTEREE